MAILTGGVGLEAEIVVQGVSRKEYAGPVNPDEDTTVSVTKYIEAEEGVNYAVRFRTTRQYEHDDYDLCWRLRIDGKIMRESLQWKEDHRKESWQTVDSITTGSKGNFMARKFLFSALATSKNCAILL
jgi:hypothetical protein